jgi:hypothetical protein
VECDAVCLLRRPLPVLKVEADLSEYLVHVYKKLQDIGTSIFLYLNCLSKGQAAASVLQSSHVYFLAHQSALNIPVFRWVQ